ncbi:recombinase family protein [Tepidibacter aestuarii]|uniref:recombinase family protein n=1 Tax=Tepidibacter aestuarii TaxID=2925782 RepID=UPI0020C04F5B|nr:recombinase family protein [Tepidibacter aestuarii]CAH2212922.1 site-specific DNA recombinase [Tepidibacter aestuarii]
MNNTCIYLRKSRADEEAEKKGDKETLLKHKKALLKYAQENNLNILKIREEIVSGESLMHRPQMLELLKDVENNLYDCVLCMDIDRLGRGNMKEQGLILETFKNSNTKIVTPRKVYNLEDEFDEEYSEFEAFMARKELKIINRRLQNGRIRSVEDGNYLGTLPPYGYEICYKDNYRTLTPHPEQSVVVNIIFDLYTNHYLGSKKIADKLNAMNYKSYTGSNWSSASVLSIIKNNVYTGRIQWRKTVNKKSNEIGKNKETKMRPKKEWIDVQGKHKAIISSKTYEKAQKILSSRSHTPFNSRTKISNPLAGVVKCFYCNSSMVLRPYKNRDSQIMCPKNCSNKSSKLIYIENKLILSLRYWLKKYEFNLNMYSNDDKNKDKLLYKNVLHSLKKELGNLNIQNNNLHDLLERNIYDESTYMSRLNSITTKIKNVQSSIDETNSKLVDISKKFDVGCIPRFTHLLDVYENTDSNALKNRLLKSVLNSVVYKKEKHKRNDEFTLIIYPKLPKE